MILFFIFAVTICLYLFYNFSRAKHTLPQGLKEIPLVRGLPIIGVIGEIKPNLPLYLTKLGKKHGPIFRIRLGMRDLVILNNFNVIKKTLKEDADNFSGRPPLRFLRYIDRNSGVVFRDGEIWSEQRSFILRVFRVLE